MQTKEQHQPIQLTSDQEAKAVYLFQMVTALGGHQDLVTQFYQREYGKRMLHDSPDRSRTEMAMDVLNLFKTGAFPNDFVLDVGSGPRAVENELRAYARSQGTKIPQMFSIDRSIFSADLLVDQRKDPTIKHAVGNALTLPFADGTFGAVFSNHALDFIPRPAEHFYQPYREAARVVAEGGYLILHCHHPSMIGEDVDSIKDKTTRVHWGYLKRNSILLSHEQEIRAMIAKLGLIDIVIEERSDSRDRWWRVIAQKA